MRALISAVSIAMAVAIVADQHRQKAEHGEDGWWDWHSRDADGVSMAKTTIWSHDAWAFILGVGVPVAMGVSAAGKRPAVPAK